MAAIADLKHETNGGVPPTEGGAPTPNAQPTLSLDEDPKTCCHRIDGTSRNLIVCIDGTDNQFGDKNTNVIELYNLILKGAEHNQRTWYNSGIGTYARPSWMSHSAALFHKVESAFAWNFQKTILDAYRWLSDTYEPGDCIFLFGFSRGAFQVRVPSAMIDKVGLIYKGNEGQIPFAYELYENSENEIEITAVGSPNQETITSAARFKQVFSYEGVTVHFVGAWDTVSSIGLIRRKAMLPGTVNGMQHVCYFRHALALDERRVNFLPEYAFGGSASLSSASSDQRSSNLDAKPPHVVNESQCSDGVTPPPKVLEVWFAGTHSDIGGGNVENTKLNRSRPPLRWMVFEAGSFGLRTKLFTRELPPNEQIDVKESLTPCWWASEVCCFRRLTYTRRDPDAKNATTFMPHLGKGRKIHRGQRIHISLILSDQTDYIPKARPLDDNAEFWQQIRDYKVSADWLERDLYIYANDLVKQYIKTLDSVSLQLMSQIAKSNDGCEAVCKSLYQHVIEIGNPSTLGRILLDTLDVLGSCSQNLKRANSRHIRTMVSELQSKEVLSGSDARRIIKKCTDPCICVLEGHTGFVSSVAFSPDNKTVASGSNDHTIQFWNAETGEPMNGTSAGRHSSCVTSVAFSSDGKHVASGSYDKFIRLWDAITGGLIGSPLEAHDDSVTSVAFSTDNKQLISGSDDKTLRIWDLQTRSTPLIPFQTLAGQVRSVAFSPDGKQVASGSSDSAVQVWDVFRKGTTAFGPFMGHSGSVRSVAFSFDGKFVASGSTDRTVRIWNAKTGRMIGKPFHNHTGWVSSVAFSFDGRRVVFGLSDHTAQIWDVESRQKLQELSGHGGTVTSVAFSHDGKRVASGSNDKTVRIWDVEVD